MSTKIVTDILDCTHFEPEVRDIHLYRAHGISYTLVEMFGWQLSAYIRTSYELQAKRNICLESISKKKEKACRKGYLNWKQFVIITQPFFQAKAPVFPVHLLNHGNTKMLVPVRFPISYGQIFP